MAFVIVQHLPPSNEGRLVEILRRATTMPVSEITDNTSVEPNCVYVIPPDRDLSIEDGVLRVSTSTVQRGLRLPIDLFFRSLAHDRGAAAIAVVLSGMGSDGTLGLAAVKERGGAVFVQEPSTARFDAMPRSAIDAQVADVVAPAGDIPARIMAFLRSRTDGSDTQSIDMVLGIVKARTGHDFALYKRRTLERRIDRRVGILGLQGITNYVDYLTLNPQEADLLFKELLIGVTSFFRDPELWEQMVRQVWPSILTRTPDGAQLRAWTAGCSTGEEAYSLAMSFVEARNALPTAERCSLQIFATDLDTSAIEHARAGVYSSNIAADVSSTRLSTFFTRDGDDFRINSSIREMVIFAPHNVAMDPPFTRLDVVMCRNLLIYLDPVLQQKVLSLFHYALRPDGVLVLGAAEATGAADDSFRPIPGTTRCFRRMPVAPSAGFGDFSITFGQPRPMSVGDKLDPMSAPLSLQTLAEALLRRHHAPVAVLVTRAGDIVYFSGETDRFLAPPAGRANLNLFAMARAGLETPLEDTFRAALRDRRAVSRTAVPFIGASGPEAVDLVVEPVDADDALDGLLLVVFTTASRSAPSGDATRMERDESMDPLDEIRYLRDEVDRLRSVLKATRDAMQASHEQIQAVNEELQSTNEELQSTNEELTTSKEEMQSMNEELQTVNQELEARVDELVGASNDMTNLLNSTSVATLFLDSSLCIRRFTPQMASIFKLIPRDLGRAITDLATILDYPGLVDDTQAVLNTLIPRQRTVSTIDDRWFDVRVMPYRTQDDRIDGVVLTFIDCTALQTMLAAVRDLFDTFDTSNMSAPGDGETTPKQVTDAVTGLRSVVLDLVSKSDDVRLRWNERADRAE